MSRRIHLSMSVRGAMQQSDADLRRMAPSITYKGKQLSTVREVREMLMDALAEGYEFLPMTDCDNFDPKKGCLGHEVEAGEESQ